MAILPTTTKFSAEKIYYHNYYYPSSTTTSRSRSPRWRRSRWWLLLFPGRRGGHAFIDRLITLAVIFGVVCIFRIHARYRQDLRDKYSATKFGDEVVWWVGHSPWDVSSPVTDTNSAVPLSNSKSKFNSISDSESIPGNEIVSRDDINSDRNRNQNENVSMNRRETWAAATGHEVLDHREEWKRVASGWEGEVFIYRDDSDRDTTATARSMPMVIKTFFTTKSPLRNCLRRRTTTISTTDSENGENEKADERQGQNKKISIANIPIPTEILAAVLLGGLSFETSSSSDGRGSGGGDIHEGADFMPVEDFFLLPATTEAGSYPELKSESATAGSASGWHLVTPFLPAGNLKDLAERLKPLNLSTRELDVRFRRSFERLLGALEKMHGKYGLCHDDVKGDNIFISGPASLLPPSPSAPPATLLSSPLKSESGSESAPQIQVGGDIYTHNHNHAERDIDNDHTSDKANANRNGGEKDQKNDENNKDDEFTHWLLGDFGNVREIEHPYHSTHIWTRDSLQHRDCRINDVVRLLRTYISFLRIASSSSSSTSTSTSTSPSISPSASSSASAKIEFDKVFWTASEPWSKLYWTAIRESESNEPFVLVDGDGDGATAAARLREMSLSLAPQPGPTPEQHESLATTTTTTTTTATITTSAVGISELKPREREHERDFSGCSSLGTECGKAVVKGGRGRGDTEKELSKGMWVTEDRARFFALTSLFGLPRGRC